MSFSETDGQIEDANTDDDGEMTGAPTALRVLTYIGSQLTQLPERVEVTQHYDENDRIKLTLAVDKADMGRVIGRHGKIAGSIRAVVRAAAAKDGTDAFVEIQERLN